MAGSRRSSKAPLVIKSAEFFSIELAPLADGTIHVSITATTVDEEEPQLLTQEIAFHTAAHIDAALALIKRGVTSPA
jgi:hypothetical protein